MVKKNEKNKNTKKKKKNNKKNKKKRTPAPPGNVRPNSFVPRAPEGTHAVESSLASKECHCLYARPVLSFLDVVFHEADAYTPR